jgi:hypothetical protein
VAAVNNFTFWLDGRQTHEEPLHATRGAFKWFSWETYREARVDFQCARNPTRTGNDPRFAKGAPVISRSAVDNAFPQFGKKKPAGAGEKWLLSALAQGRQTIRYDPMYPNVIDLTCSYIVNIRIPKQAQRQSQENPIKM